jgi:hypothetical protein
MNRTFTRLSIAVAAGIALCLTGAGTAGAATTSGESGGSTVTYAGTARVEVATWGRCGAGARAVKLSDRTVQVDVALVIAGVGTGTNRVEFVLGSPASHGDGTFVVATADGSRGQRYWNTRYDDATGRITGAIDPDTIGAAPLYNIVRTRQPYTPCDLAAGTAEATQALGRSTVLAGRVTAGTATFVVRGATTDGRATFVITTSTLRPAAPDTFGT